ncbi:hypothetical protein V8E52_007759, partial [Russula decolorans]
AFKSHALAVPFDRPGRADLNANLLSNIILVDLLQHIATAHGPLSQHSFILHIGTRATALRRVASFPEGGLGRQQRPVDTAGRGKEYKVMGV